MADVSFVSLPGVLTCAVGGVIRIVAWTLNKEASQIASAKRIDSLSGGLEPMVHDSSPDSRDPRLDCTYVHEIIDDDVVVYADLKRERSDVPQLVAVSGAAWAENPIECELSDRRAVLTEVLHPQIIWSIFSMTMVAIYSRESHSYDEPEIYHDIPGSL